MATSDAQAAIADSDVVVGYADAGGYARAVSRATFGAKPGIDLELGYQMRFWPQRSNSAGAVLQNRCPLSLAFSAIRLAVKGVFWL